MALRTAAMADNAVSDAMGNVFAPDRTQLHQPVPIVLPEDTLQALRRILRQEDNAALHGVQSVQRCRLDNLELGIMCTATEASERCASQIQAVHYSFPLWRDTAAVVRATGSRTGQERICCCCSLSLQGFTDPSTRFSLEHVQQTDEW